MNFQINGSIGQVYKGKFIGSDPSPPALLIFLPLTLSLTMQACTDLLSHQKQLTVGLPPEPREKTISA